MLQLILNALHLAGSVLLLIAGIRIFMAGLKISGGLITGGVVVSAIFSNVHKFIAFTWAAGEGMPFWFQASLSIGQFGTALVGFGVLNLANHIINKSVQPTVDAAAD